MNYYLTLGIILFIYMSCWFVISLLKKRNDVADIAWGLGFVVMAWVSYALAKTFFSPSIVINALVTIWGLRLATHIYRRNHGKPEDSRYAAWRQQWGKWFLVRSYFQVFILQGVFLFLIALPVVFFNQNSATNFSWFEVGGVVIWLIGFFFETVGDRQLAQFIKNPANKGRLMQSGLWSYSRHPNYFGEVVQWWGIFIMTLSLPHGWMTIVGPLTITILILFVSGVPLLEKKYAGREDFEEYKKRTSVFFPLPKRKI